MVTTFTYKPSWWGSMQAISIYHGNRSTNKQTHRQDRLQYTAPLSLACSATSSIRSVEDVEHVCVGLSGYKSAFALSRTVGWQSFYRRRPSDADLPAVPHVRPLHAQCVHPGAGVLRTPGGIQGTVPPCREGARQVRLCLSVSLSLSLSLSLSFSACIVFPSSLWIMLHLHRSRRVTLWTARGRYITGWMPNQQCQSI